MQDFFGFPLIFLEDSVVEKFLCEARDDVEVVIPWSRLVILYES